MGSSQSWIILHLRNENEWISHTHSFLCGFFFFSLSPDVLTSNTMSIRKYLLSLIWSSQTYVQCELGVFPREGWREVITWKKTGPVTRPALWRHLSPGGRGWVCPCGSIGPLPLQSLSTGRGRGSFGMAVFDVLSPALLNRRTDLMQAYGVHWVCRLIFQACRVQDFPRYILPSVCILVSTKGRALCTFLIHLPWNYQNTVFWRCVTSRKVLLNF